LASVGSGSWTPRNVSLLVWWERQSLKWNSAGVPVATSPDDRDTVTHADEPGQFLFVHHGLLGLKGGGRTELHL
jgi:hypothetical protein